MRPIAKPILRQFWERHPQAKVALEAWWQIVSAADWNTFNDVRQTFAAADLVGNKVVFNIGGNKYRLIAVIDYEGHKVFIRYVLTHPEYDEGSWKADKFGDNWTPRIETTNKPKRTRDASRRRT